MEDELTVAQGGPQPGLGGRAGLCADAERVVEDDGATSPFGFRLAESEFGVPDQVRTQAVNATALANA
ncbi:MAG: hypothetical protein WB383_02100 [Acidimicrobiales bacterium]